MTNLTQKEIQLLDGLETCEPILAAIQEHTGTRFVVGGRFDDDSLAYRIWLDPSEKENAFEEIIKRAWELAADRDEDDFLCWGDHVEYR